MGSAIESAKLATRPPPLANQEGGRVDMRALLERQPANGGASRAGAPKAASLPATAKVSESQLRAINPTFSTYAASGAFPDASAEGFLVKGYAKPESDRRIYTITRPIGLGGGVVIPVGTKISDERGGTIGGPREDVARRPALSFSMPNGNVLKMTFRQDARTGLQGTQFSFTNAKNKESGRTFFMVGAPFFNPKTGTLARVVSLPTPAGGNGTTPKSFRLHNSMMDSSFVNDPGRDVSAEGDKTVPMNGREAQAAIRSAIQGNAPATPNAPGTRNPVAPPKGPMF